MEIDLYPPTRLLLLLLHPPTFFSSSSIHPLAPNTKFLLLYSTTHPPTHSSQLQFKWLQLPTNHHPSSQIGGLWGGWVGGWVGGWMNRWMKERGWELIERWVVGWVEENEAVRMSCCEGGWVGGWVGGFTCWGGGWRMGRGGGGQGEGGWLTVMWGEGGMAGR